LVDVKVGSRVAVMSGEKSRPQRLLYWICVSQGGLIVNCSTNEVWFLTCLGS
jgi:hypothetical protein